MIAITLVSRRGPQLARMAIDELLRGVDGKGSQKIQSRYIHFGTKNPGEKNPPKKKKNHLTGYAGGVRRFRFEEEL